MFVLFFTLIDCSRCVFRYTFLKRYDIHAGKLFSNANHTECHDGFLFYFRHWILLKFTRMYRYSSHHHHQLSDLTKAFTVPAQYKWQWHDLRTHTFVLVMLKWLHSKISILLYLLMLLFVCSHLHSRRQSLKSVLVSYFYCCCAALDVAQNAVKRQKLTILYRFFFGEMWHAIHIAMNQYIVEM